MSGQGALGQHALSTFCCCALVCGDIVQPLQGWLWFGWLTQGRNRWFQPWAILWNPVGILPRRCSAALFVSANSAFNESLGQGQTLSSPPAGERKKVRGRPAMLSLTWLKHSPLIRPSATFSPTGEKEWYLASVEAWPSGVRSGRLVFGRSSRRRGAAGWCRPTRGCSRGGCGVRPARARGGRRFFG